MRGDDQSARKELQNDGSLGRIVKGADGYLAFASVFRSLASGSQARDADVADTLGTSHADWWGHVGRGLTGLSNIRASQADACGRQVPKTAVGGRVAPPVRSADVVEAHEFELGANPIGAVRTIPGIAGADRPAGSTSSGEGTGRSGLGFDAGSLYTGGRERTRAGGVVTCITWFEGGLAEGLERIFPVSDESAEQTFLAWGAHNPKGRAWLALGTWVGTRAVAVAGSALLVLGALLAFLSVTAALARWRVDVRQPVGAREVGELARTAIQLGNVGVGSDL